MVYLDNAATSLKKPAGVERAILKGIRYGANAGRGGHKAVMNAENTIFECRNAASELFGLNNPENVVLTFNATHALNIAISTFGASGGRAIISGYEHNAVTRPLWALGVRTVKAAAPLFDAGAMLDEFRRKLGRASFAVCTHASNVFGMVMPIKEIDALCAARGVPLIIDASQSAGCEPLDLGALRSAAFVCMPGHKGLYGPQGTGLLLCAGGVKPKCILYGGTGGDSKNRGMPEYLPDRLEAGTRNLPGIAGLYEGLRFVAETGPENIGRHERKLTGKIIKSLSATPGVVVYAPKNGLHDSGVLSFNVEGLDCEEAALMLAERNIAVRAGFHCAPSAHKSGGTYDIGTVRVSVSAFTTEQEIDYFLAVISDLILKYNNRA